MIDPLLAIVAAFAVLFGLMGAGLARGKNRSAFEGFFLGAVLGLVGIIIVIILPTLARPGWYYDPWRVSTWRWFDGTNWTEYSEDTP